MERRITAAEKGINVTSDFDVFAQGLCCFFPCICTMQKNFIPICRRSRDISAEYRTTRLSMASCLSCGVC